MIETASVIENEPTSTGLIDELVVRVTEEVKRRRTTPRVTYRLEFHKEHFGFRDAAAIVPYLAQLGISHVYASPYFKVHSEASHGYAVVDPTQLNPDLGTQHDYDAFVAALHAHGMGQILDIVPNHMAAAPGENAWWTDVLENGQSSPSANYFDVEWNPVEQGLHNRILLPFLGQQFGQVLEAGELKVEYRDGRFVLCYYNRCLPLDPGSVAGLVSRGVEEFRASQPPEEDLLELESILTAIQHLPARTATEAALVRERAREKQVIQDRLKRLTDRSPAVLEHIQKNLTAINGQAGDPSSFNELETLLDQQVYRLAHWKAASDEVNYRRFFDVNELIAICTEEPDVFAATHRLIFDLLVSGQINGLRIDHVDGLYDPRQYLWRLQWGYLQALGKANWDRLPEDESNPAWEEVEAAYFDAIWPALGLDCAESIRQIIDPHSDLAIELPAPQIEDVTQLPLYVVVEKILGPEEPLPPDWPIAGTSGYDFMNLVNGLFVNPEGFAKLRRNYERFTGESGNFQQIVQTSKQLVLDVSMSSELALLGQRLKRIAMRQRHSRDFTLNTLLAALRDIIVCFPVYRTYSGPGGVSPRDRTVLDRAIRGARRMNPVMDGAVFAFIRQILLWEADLPTDPAELHEREQFVGRFQQVTSPVMAKGVEDTAFYRFLPLISVNEVGSHPPVAANSIEDFHRENEKQATRYPFALLGTSTHDTKRSEDVRSRLHILSEIPDVWRTTLSRWARWNRRYHRDLQGDSAPSKNDEQLFYQTLIGMWPASPPTEEQHEQLVARLQQYMEKAIHEAKQHTSWISPEPEYEAAVRDFITGVMQPGEKNRFLAEVVTFVNQLATPGALTSASQALLKVTSPGVPDIYQGQETWDFSLVDPDNRRPVDYASRGELLRELEARLSSGPDAQLTLARELAAAPLDPRFKLFVTWQALQVREQHPELWSEGRYVPIPVDGPAAAKVCAFAWIAQDEKSATALIVVPRFWGSLLQQKSESALAPDIWGDTRLSTGELPQGELVNQFTGVRIPLTGQPLELSELLADFPLGLFVTSLSK
ncbi:malto-oligosyltrehalose synthase [Planctomicrobium piriforme]|uniref:(1->4)-alpha-D-glucan 1-alpha-D-glucosylmutase n=1 Tax=Planctomicrobium piriforme TaxID=1576369 RepID=A0A1I3FTJ7_9PLAN|nr:malto-oligosyltrehalose synthase [Planctomicrobium piriforme]SFI14560.1 (1->4)-alpha-D-glucan 1-alpha-D-glucosylmutase [Planctomicrobium piriforme]